MGFNNPDLPWRELERRLSDRPRRPAPAAAGGGQRGRQPGLVGGPLGLRGPARPGAPARRRALRRAPLPLVVQLPRRVELARGAGGGGGPPGPGGAGPHRPRRLLRRGPLRRGGPGPRACPPCSAPSCRSASPGPRTASADPEGTHLLVLARDPEGYASLASTISAAQLTGAEKGKPVYDDIDLRRRPPRPLAGAHRVPQGRGARRRWRGPGPAAAARELPRAGRHLRPAQRGRRAVRPRRPARLGTATTRWPRSPCAAGVEVVATTNAHYATPAGRRLATALAAVRARRSLDEIDGWLPACAGAHLRSGEEQARRFARWPGAVAMAAELGRACAFDLQLVAPQLPPFPCPDGLDEMGYLRRLTDEGAERRYGPRGAERIPGAYAQIDHELDLIEQLGFPGYFLVVWDIVDFCRREGIYCQGRGSAANSAVCFALGITNADAVALGLLFERFLSPERDGPPDIDIDIESGRREEAIQHVYERTAGATPPRWPTSSPTGPSRRSATWPRRSATRRASRTPGRSRSTPGAAWPSPPAQQQRRRRHPADVLELAAEVEHAPRHLGIHSGGMVICDRPVVEVCPVEWARMEDRSVLQWDKDDCAAVGLVKFDLLGLGMLAALHGAFDHVAATHGVAYELATIPQEDPEVYDMLCRGRLGRRVPGRVPGPDGHAAPAAAAQVLRPRGRGGPHPARADPGRLGPPLHPPPQRAGGGHLPAPAARAEPGEDARRAAVPGAAHADGHRRRRLHAGRGRPAAPGHGLQAQPRAHGAAAPALLRRHGRARASPARWPSRSGRSWPPSPTTASPRATRCPSPTSSTRRRG